MPSNHLYKTRLGSLVSDLHRSIQGEVRFDDGSRALYSTDASNYRQIPVGVVLPRDGEDIVRTVDVARRYGAPILARGGGTSLAGQCCNEAIVIDMSKYMNHIIGINSKERTAEIEPGVVLDDLREAAERFRLTFGPDPATHNHCTLGGMIGNNSCGVHSVYTGKTDDNVEELEILTYSGLRMRVGKTSDEQLARLIHNGGPQGEIYAKLKALRDRYADLIRQRFPKIPRRVSGYNLDQLLPENGFHVARALVGSESTCVLVLSAVVCLAPSPPARTLVVLGFRDIATGGDHLMEILSYKPLALEGIDDVLVNSMKKKGLHTENLELLPEGTGWLLVEFGGQSKEESDENARAMINALKQKSEPPSIKLFEDNAQERMVWKIRESGLGATAFVPGEPVTWEGWEDSAVPPEKVGAYLRDLRTLFDRYNYRGALYGHLGQGCIHTRINFDLFTADGIKKFRSFVEEAADLVLSYGGSLSGEHGDGQSRAELLPKMFGPELIEAFREFKTIWDPDGMMNPGKLVNPYRLDENLRLGPEYRPMRTRTHFQYPKDQGDFANAVLHCVGVGECRKAHSGVMCPSYMVTGEEKHSTRGRARLLHEMMRRDVLLQGWQDENVKDALDLCLACKGCKTECPVEVDMATYKAEFLAHYYQGRFRPRTAYSMGLIHIWSRLASVAPTLVNFITQNRHIGFLAQTIAGISSERQIPLFAKQPFRKWFAKRLAVNTGKPPVILWPDTFNNYFHPQILSAAVEVLEAADFCVILPPPGLCCGRPLYDYGMLPRAKKQLRKIIGKLREEVARGTPVVGLEPSCIAVFRDEMQNFFPDDKDAQQLSKNAFLLSEFLIRKANFYRLPHLNRKATVHFHCHHRAVMGASDEEKVLRGMGLDYQILDSGCCGMAGSFGFEKDHYDISIQVGERVLLPAIRKLDADTLLIADGFSCREQISQCAGKQAFHLAEVLRMALHPGV